MRAVPLPSFLLALCLLSSTPALMAQDLAAKVATVLAQADSAPLDRVFALGLQLTEQVDEKQTDPARDAIVAGVAKLGDKARLCAAVALQDLKNDTTYGKDVLEVLMPVAQSKDDAARASAIALLGEDRFYNTRKIGRAHV